MKIARVASASAVAGRGDDQDSSKRGGISPLSLTLTEGQHADSPRLGAVLGGICVKRAGRSKKRPGEVRLDRGYTGNPCCGLLHRR